MSLPFVQRAPTEKEIERLRLILSTYQDGTGMLQSTTKRQGTLPGWRDFERACALTFEGKAVESKFFVDVIFRYATSPSNFYGINCKMKRELSRAQRDGKIYIEVSNASRFLSSYLTMKGIDARNFQSEPEVAGDSLIEAMEISKKNQCLQYPEGPILPEKCHYLVLLWSERQDLYQLYLLPLALPNPGNLSWTYRISKKKDGSNKTCLVGRNSDGVLYEWYDTSGGQLKYYPSVSEAVWISPPFELEPLLESTDLGILAKAQAYFPELWQRASDE